MSTSQQSSTTEPSPDQASGPLSPLVVGARWLFTNGVFTGFAGLLGLVLAIVPGSVGRIAGVLIFLLMILVLADNYLQGRAASSGNPSHALRGEQLLASLSMLVALAALAFTVNWGLRLLNEQPLTNRPLRAHAWGLKNDSGQQASGTLTMDSDGAGPYYRLGYNLPAENTYAGLSFTFNEAQQLAGFSTLRVGISFEGDDPLCAAFLKREETPDDERQPEPIYYNMRPVGFDAPTDIKYVSIPLDEFAGGAPLDQFREIGFQTGGTNSGEGACRIHEVTLVRFGS